MKTVILFFLFVITFCNSASSQDTAAVVAKSEVINVSDKEIQDANERLANLIKDGDYSTKLFNRFVFIGPHLWDVIKDLPDFKNIEGGNLTFKVPKFESNGSWKKTYEMYGKVLQTKSDLKNLFKYLNESMDFSKSEIVPKNLTDKFICWQYYAKIEEPILATRNTKARLVFEFINKNLYFIEVSQN